MRELSAPRIAGLPGEAGFDAVLAWDLLGYLDAQSIGRLFAQLPPAPGRGTLLHLLLYTGATMPAQPGRFDILGARRLRRATPAAGVIANPRHSPHTLGRMLPQFRLLHSFLSRSGVQEFLFANG